MSTLNTVFNLVLLVGVLAFVSHFGFKMWQAERVYHRRRKLEEQYLTWVYTLDWFSMGEVEAREAQGHLQRILNGGDLSEGPWVQ